MRFERIGGSPAKRNVRRHALRSSREGCPVEEGSSDPYRLFWLHFVAETVSDAERGDGFALHWFRSEGWEVVGTLLFEPDERAIIEARARTGRSEARRIAFLRKQQRARTRRREMVTETEMACAS